MSLDAPSASAMICLDKSQHTVVSTAVNSARSGVTPLAPLAKSSTVSLVDMQPSESIRSKVTPVADLNAVAAWSAVITASVVITTSIVANAGAIMPAPLAMPPIVKPPTLISACLETVSVVMIAVAAAPPPLASSSVTATWTPARILTIGNR